MSKVVIFLTLFNVIYAYKILVYNPKFGKSHVMLTGKIADIIAKAGHEVVGFEFW